LTLFRPCFLIFAYPYGKVDSFTWESLTTFAEVVDSFPKNVDFRQILFTLHLFLPAIRRAYYKIRQAYCKISGTYSDGIFGGFAEKTYLCSMRAVIQRVREASVTIVDGNDVAASKAGQTVDKRSIGQGFLVLLGVCDEDSQEDVEWLVKKIAGLRVFDDAEGVMNVNIQDIGGEVLVVSQFTLYASYKKGNRPSWFRAGSHEHSIPLYESFCRQLTEAVGRPVKTGEFGANMQVELLNDGPVTICMDTKNKE